jgi:signal transduction histidine kinase
MKILFKISVAILVLLLISGASVLLITRTNSSQKELFLKTSSRQLQKSFSIITSLSSLKHELPAKDYSAWNEMCAFIRTHDKAWADDNIATMLTSYKINAVWIIDTCNETIYEKKDQPFVFPEVIAESHNLIPDLKTKHILKTYLLINNTLIELFGATITNTEDSVRRKRPQGYLFVTKVWDKNYISQFEQITASKISIVGKSDSSAISNDSIVVYNKISNSLGGSIGYFRISQPAEYIRSNHRLSNSILIILVITTLLIMAVVIYSLISWLGKPLYYIEAILKGNKEKIKKLKKAGHEYVQIADLMEKSENLKVELAIAKDTAEESNKLKTTFLQNMTHEFRTPLNAIIGFSQLIEESYGNREELKFYSSCIYHSGNELLRFANEILDVSRLESGKMPVHLEEFSLTDVLSMTESYFINLNKNLNKPDVKFLVNNTCDPDRTIVTDKKKLIHILNNLVHNALKFTQSGLIEIGCTATDDNSVTFNVSDTGIGIDEEKIPSIFEKFHQIDNSMSRNYSGSGLGLSIVKSYLELIGGTIHVSSLLGKGSNFSFTIPDNK